MKKKLSKHYNEDFYWQHKSVIDIGCGQGSWLAAAESLGTIVINGMATISFMARRKVACKLFESGYGILEYESNKALRKANI